MNSNFTIGDVLIRRKGGVISRHYALYAGIDRMTGQELVAENQTGYGVRVITLVKFLNDGKLTKIERNNLPLFRQERVISRINQLIGKRYHLSDYNCEHFVNHVLHGKIESSQVAMVGLGAVAAVTLALVLKG